MGKWPFVLGDLARVMQEIFPAPLRQLWAEQASNCAQSAFRPKFSSLGTVLWACFSFFVVSCIFQIFNTTSRIKTACFVHYYKFVLKNTEWEKIPVSSSSVWTVYPRSSLDSSLDSRLDLGTLPPHSSVETQYFFNAVSIFKSMKYLYVQGIVLGPDKHVRCSP